MTIEKEQFREDGNVCVQHLFSQLFKKIEFYNPYFDKEKLKRVFEFSLKAHKGQFRESGEPYIVHPLSVAIILAEYYVCEDTIITALLHDVLEDSEEVSYEKIKSEFGETVAQLVESVTKISEFVSDEYIQRETELSYKAADAETIRKIFRKAKQDIRLVLVKLADRLHNMQTLDAVSSPVKRYRKAQETLYVFVPMAARLGIWKMKHRLENLCFPYIFPDENEKICTFIENKRNCLNGIVSRVMRNLQDVDKNGIIRAMYPYSRGIFYLKKALDEKNTITPNDYLTFHVCVDSEDDCYLVLGFIHRTWKTRIKKEEDYISNPRDNGYRAYHTRIVTEDGFLVEIRIMTHEMRMKNWYGSAYRCFQRREENNAHIEFLMPFEIISKKTHGKSFEFLEAAKTDLLEEKIEVHVSGESVYVPEAATVLDFVFYTFPKKAVYVSKICLNDKEVSFDTRLSDGDIVEVDFSDEPTLSFKWFDLIKTATARMRIQEVLRGWGLDKKVNIGKNILQREFDIYGKGDADVFLNKNKKKMCDFFNVSDPKDLYVFIAGGELNSYEIFSAFFPKTKANFCRKFFYKWDLFLTRFFGGKGQVLRMKITGILENEVDILHTMNVARHNLGISAISTNLKENKKSDIFNFRMNISADNEKALRDFFILVEHQKGVIRVLPLLSHKKQRWFLFWFLLAVFIWGLIPIIFALENHLILPTISSLKTILLYANLVPTIVVNYILYSFMCNYFSQLRNTVWMIVIGLLLNLFWISIFLWQLAVFGFSISLPVIIGFFAALTFVFFYRYLSLSTRRARIIAGKIEK